MAYRSTLRGTHQGPFLGVAPTGHRVTVSFLAIVRVEDGRLAEEWGGLDQVDLLRQLRNNVGPQQCRPAAMSARSNVGM